MSLTPKIVASLFTPDPPLPADDFGFVHLRSAQPENIKYGPLTLIKDDGTTAVVRCTRWTATKAEPVCSCDPTEQIFYSEDHKQALKVPSRYLSAMHLSLPPNLVTMTETVEKEKTDRRLAAIREPLISKIAQQAHRAKEREQRIAVYKNRTFNVILGALITPLEVATGVVRMV